MAWLEKNRPNGPFQLVVRYGTQRLKRSTRTSDAPRANEIALRVDRRLEMLDRGELTLPDDVDLLTFLMSDGTAPNRTKPVASVTLEQVCDEYLDSLPAGSLEENTLLTCRIDMRHLKRLLGAGRIGEGITVVAGASRPRTEARRLSYDPPVISAPILSQRLLFGCANSRRVTP